LSNVIRLSVFAQRDHLGASVVGYFHHNLLHRFFGHSGGHGEVGFYYARVDRVDSDALVNELCGHLNCQLIKRRLRHRVVGIL
ncbi:hypothetical protein PMAYCL1PPCAC_16929, partial [Pristionchus mayeri]